MQTIERTERAHINSNRVQYKTDGVGYNQSDSGCWVVSRYLGKPARCFNCPFADCIIDLFTPGYRYEFIIKELMKIGGKQDDR